MNYMYLIRARLRGKKLTKLRQQYCAIKKQLYRNDIAKRGNGINIRV
jgi:hypothetical protein